MTIGAVSYQEFPIVGYATGVPQIGREAFPESSAYANLRNAIGVNALEGIAGVNISTGQVIDILLGQLDQLSYQLARSEPQADPVIVEANIEAGARVETEAYASDEARMDALLEQYSQLRAEVETEGLDNPFAPAGPFVGMLFDIGV